MNRPKARSVLSLRSQLAILKKINEACEHFMDCVENDELTIEAESKIVDLVLEGLYGSKVHTWIEENS